VRDKIESAKIASVNATQTGAARVSSTTATGASQIVSAIGRNRPIVNVDVSVVGTTVKVDKTYSNGDMGGGGGGRRAKG